jgi:hypothetical protein
MVNRNQERGVAIFIVVMVLTMLSAIGVFAMRAASMATLTSGYDRQSTQNQLAGDYGMLAAATELGSSRVNGQYGEMMRTKSDVCFANRGRSSDGGAYVPCLHLTEANIQQNVAVPIFAPASGSLAAPPVVPGSLGPAGLAGAFDVEITDPGPVGLPVKGANLGNSNLKYKQVTLTSTGQVRPTGDGGSACVAAGNISGRAYIVIGPIQ